MKKIKELYTRLWEKAEPKEHAWARKKELRDLKAEKSRLENRLRVMERSFTRAAEEKLELAHQNDSLLRVVERLTNGYATLYRAFVALGGDPDAIPAEETPANR